MTPRSPNPSKTSTISRRLRSRADQNLSVQPPELPQIRSLRTRRAVTLPSSHSPPVPSQPEEPQAVWNPEILDPFQRGHTSVPSGFVVRSTSDSNLPHPQELTPHLSPHLSPHQSSTALSPLSSHPDTEPFDLPSASESELLPSHLPNLSFHRSPGEYDIRLSEDPEHLANASVDYQDMTALGFMVSPQYGSLDHYGSPAPLESQNYSAMHHQQPTPSSSSGYAPAYSSSPSLQSQPRTSSEHIVLPPYQPNVPRSPYQQPLGSMRTSPTPMSYPPTSNDTSSILSSQAHSYTYPAIQPSLPGQGIGSLGSSSSSYPPPPVYPPTTYDMGYNPLPTSIYPSSSASAYAPYNPTAGLAPPNSAGAGLSSSPGDQRNGVRVLNSRPKPQCWEHGCNGRQFSTFSNLLRHQREKSGTAAKSYCPRCGAEFTRTTARNGHMAHDKCKPRRTSDSSR